MIEITAEQLKKIELDILLDVARFCDEHGLRYFLAYGTLIGAVRHKGFIPWDDDVDLHMPREDYNYVIKHYNEDGRAPYRLISPMDEVSRHSFVKVIDDRTVKIEKNVKYDASLGVDIDIFPLDGVPEEEKEFKKWYKRLMTLYRLHFYYILDPKAVGGKTKIPAGLIKLLPGGKNRILRRAAKLHEMYSYDKSGVVGECECLFTSEIDRYNKDWFSSAVELEFEGHLFKAPVGYDKVLRQYYGDYMQLPPEEKQKTHHANNVFWK